MPELFKSIKGDEAAALIAGSPAVEVTFDDEEASRLALQKGDQVSVSPSDTGTLFACI